jgi:arginine decarboxylase
MMHASTSPFYPMIAVLDVAAAMMDGPGRSDAHRRIDP